MNTTIENLMKQQKSKDNFVFDPFGIHSSSNQAAFHETSIPPVSPKPDVSKEYTRRNPTLTPDDVVEATRPIAEILHRGSGASIAPRSPKMSPLATKSMTVLPPKVNILLSSHEDVTSVALNNDELEGSSEIYVEGNLSAQVISSDATKNLPFCVTATTPGGTCQIKFQPNGTYTELSPQHLPTHSMMVVDIPKSEIISVPIGTYALTEKVMYMPLLLERKVTMYEKSVRLALQVRSKLLNNGDLQDFTIAVAIPERVNADTIEITRGQGVLDALKRTIKWSIPDLPKGESFMVSAQAQLWSNVTNEDQLLLRFPVMLRCSSQHDQISSISLTAEEASGFPSTITYNRRVSFRLMHRLP